jgi:predicted fused transcriptional regulator/phosphomethylpyrimidine kinase
MSRKWVNQTANDVVAISGRIWNDDTRTVANAVNHNAQILKDALNRIAELEKRIDILQAEGSDKK